MYTIPSPRTMDWPNPTEMLVGLVEIFDWDLIQLSTDGADSYANVIGYQVPLCTQGLPCKIEIFGKSTTALLHRTGEGEIYCAAANGCESVSLTNILVECNGPVASQAPVRVDGAVLMIRDCQFSTCSSRTDGGSVQALEAKVTILNTTFHESFSMGSGGAISLVGSMADINDCSFFNCSALDSGGSISVLDYQCTSSKMLSSVMNLDSSLFSGCQAQRGGAVTASSGVISITESVFVQCESSTIGGGLAISDGYSIVQLNITNTIFSGNIAHGEGGGAVYLSNTATVLAGLECSIKDRKSVV